MRNFRRSAVLIPSVLFLLVIIVYVSIAVYVATRAEKDSMVKSDAIVVLGARSYIEGKYNPCLEARVGHAVELYKDGAARKLVVSGGDDREDNVNEAETMKKMAMEMGVNNKDILLEKNATSTYENFKLSQEILKKNNLKSVIVVTEPFHMARAALIAEKLGYDYTVSPAVDSPCWVPNKYFSKYFLKEPIAIAAYRLQRKL